VSFGTPQASSAGAGRDGVNNVAPSSTLFSENGFLAYTTTWFDDSGQIQEADIQIDQKGIAGAELETLVKHEVGHLLGFDHSANLSSIMYPFVGPVDRLDTDDRLGLVAVYPSSKQAPRGVIRGQIASQGSAVFSAQLVLVDAKGSPISTALSDRDGRFEFGAVPDGSYRVYAEPLDGPIDGAHLSGIYRTGGTAFRTDFMSGNVVVSNGTVSEIVLQADSTPASLNPKWIGSFEANARDMSLSSNVTKVKAGSTIALAVGGDGIIGGLTTFEVVSEKFQRVSEFSYGPNYVYATFKVGNDAPEGSSIVIVRNGSEAATLTGAVRVDGKGSRPRPVR
jgi:hypothetical protein